MSVLLKALVVRPALCYSAATRVVIYRSLSDQQSKSNAEQRKFKNNAEQRQVQLADAFSEKPYSSMSTGEKVVEGSKDTFYFLVILGGIAATCLAGYIVFRELLSRETPNGIYSEALKICRDNEELRILLGSPLKGYGEENSRGRRRNIAHEEFMLDGRKCMRMRFHVKGSIAEGEVNLEVRKNDSDKYSFRYLFVETPSSRRPVIIFDNRGKQ